MGECMRREIFIVIFFLFFITGCAPLRDTAGRISDDIGEAGDEIGKERVLGDSDSGVVLHPQGDKKVKMAF